MKVNGYMLKEALRVWSEEIEMLTERFENSLQYYPSDKEIPDLEEIYQKLMKAYRAKALLESYQQQYNLQIGKIKANKAYLAEEEISLSVAIKLIPGLGAMNNLWKKAATVGENKVLAYRLGGLKESRAKDTEYPVKTMNEKNCFYFSKEITKFVSQLRSSIALKNGEFVELDIEPWIFSE